MKLFYTIFFTLFICIIFAQSDSQVVAKPTTIKVVKPVKLKQNIEDTNSNIVHIGTDTLLTSVTKDSINYDSIHSIKKDSSIYQLLINFPIVNNNKPELMLISFREVLSKDVLFYVLLGIVFYLALIKLIFPKHIKNIFAIIFQTKYRQVQTREQLVQDNVASMLLNVLFIFSFSLFIGVVVNKFYPIQYKFWQVSTTAAIVLVCIYIFKLLFTQFIGFIFNTPIAANAYNFIVFVVNKILGVALIPFIFLISFSSSSVSQWAFNLSILVIAFLLLFRLFLTYKNISNILKINAFHFFLYFCGIEILPLLLMYKVLNNYIGNGI